MYVCFIYYVNVCSYVLGMSISFETLMNSSLNDLERTGVKESDLRVETTSHTCTSTGVCCVFVAKYICLNTMGRGMVHMCIPSLQ